jgi:hypothetical protein
MKILTHSVLLAALLGLSLPAGAAVLQFTAILNGQNETNGSGTFGLGDLDGSGVATLLIDDVANTIDWNIVANDIVMPLTGAHIHQGDSGVNGSVVVNFNSALAGSGLFDADLAAVIANPGGFYVNLHNADFPAGAIRGQIAAIPEPAAAGLMLAGLALVGWRLSQRRT